jgi:4-hydroxybenzoate polyprenyltransferase/phosphoserine phosphatase
MESRDETQVPLPTGEVEISPGTSRGPSAFLEGTLRPLCVDLDGTLLKTDMLWESFIACLKLRPWQALLVPFWLCSGKARLKQELAKGLCLDWETMPYTPELLEYLREAKAAGRQLVLVSACDRSIAEAIAQHLGLFSEVLASDGETNLKGAAKAAALSERFGLGGFDYAGNERADVPVWAAARERLVVNAPPRLLRRLEQPSERLQVIAPRPSRLRAVFRALRCHQWSKNLLVFLPVVAAHAYFDWSAVKGAALMFLAWCFAASGIYVGNDLLDLEADRSHPTKRRRPFASGDLPLPVGLALAPGLFAVGFGLAASISGTCAVALLCYVGCAYAYSWHLKKRSLVDVFTLAFLFTIRVVGGGLASGYPVTMWLLAFSGFLFLGLAFLKRCSELVRIQELGRRHLGSRAYGVADLRVLEMFGVASAFTAIMVLGLYLNSAVAETHYRWPTALWAEAPFLLLWLCRLWLATARGEMHDDPIVYSMKDWVSWVLGGCVLAAFIVATIG